MTPDLDLNKLAQQIKKWGKTLGFQQVGICSTDLAVEEPRLQKWIDKHYHGEMDWIARYGMMRARPHELLPGTVRVISVRMNYLPPKAAFASALADPSLGYISRYALGRDYHKLVRRRLKQLGDKIQHYCAQFNLDSTSQKSIAFRPFVDTAPILERPLASQAGLGWVGKHSLIINPDAGSWFFLGELLIDLALPVDSPQPEQCGRCVACMTICPTKAIIEPYVVDARRCISYLTIELEGAIPIEFRTLIGNRIYGCDDCQLICPWNRFAQLTTEDDFNPRVMLHTPKLLELFRWSEATFLHATEGSPIRRIGYMRWLRNIAVALGNAPHQPDILSVLQQQLGLSDLLDEHIHWAITQQQQKKNIIPTKRDSRIVTAIKKGLPRDA